MVRRDRHESDMAPRLVEHATTAAASSRALVHHASALQRSRFQYYDGEYHYYYPDYDYPPEEAKFIGIIPWALNFLRICAIGLLLLASSAVCYGIFYWAVMPGNYASRPLFFDYTGTAEYAHHDVVTLDPTVPAVPQKAKKSKRIWNKQVATVPVTPNTHDSCTYTPWATVDLFAREQAVTWGDTLHPDLMPPQETKDRILQPKQGYYVEVYLTLPESSVNRQTGMFGVAVDLLSQPSGDNDDTKIKLASSVRSARLPHESGWLAVARKLAWIFPITFFGMEESQTVVVPSFRHIVESKEYPLRHAVVRLVSQASYLHPPQTQQPELQQPKPPVEVIGGEIRIGKELNAWQQVLKDRYYLCYLCGTLILFGAHVGAWILIQYYLSETEDYGESYSDPSFDFNDDENVEGSNNNDSNNGDNNDDEDFESLNGDDGSGQPSSPGLHGDRQPGMDSNTGQDTNEHHPYNEDEDSHDWEECSPEEDHAADGLFQEERQSQPGPMHAGHHSRLLTREQITRNEIDAIAKRRVARERGAAGRVPRDKYRPTDPFGRIIHHNPLQNRQATFSREPHRTNMRKPDKTSSPFSSQAKLPVKAIVSNPTDKKAAKKPGPVLDIFFDCSQDGAEDAECLNDERQAESNKRLNKDSPSLLAASGMGCSGSSSSTSTPLHNQRNQIDLTESISSHMTFSAKPPLPEVNFISSRSFELSPIALTPARGLNVQATTDPLSKAAGENEQCDVAATRNSTFKGRDTSTRSAQAFMLKPKAANPGTQRDVSGADMTPEVFLDTKRRPEITPPTELADNLFSENSLSDGFAGTMFPSEFPPERAVNFHVPGVPSSTADSQSEESEKAIKLGFPAAPSLTDSQSEGSTVDNGPEAVANQVVGVPKVSIFDIPEAQMLDSFLHDLINPFVR